MERRTRTIESGLRAKTHTISIWLHWFEHVYITESPSVSIFSESGKLWNDEWDWESWRGQNCLHPFTIVEATNRIEVPGYNINGIIIVILMDRYRYQKKKKSGEIVFNSSGFCQVKVELEEWILTAAWCRLILDESLSAFDYKLWQNWWIYSDVMYVYGVTSQFIRFSQI